MLRTARTLLATVAVLGLFCGTAQAITVTMFGGLGYTDTWQVVPMPDDTVWIINNVGYSYATPGSETPISIFSYHAAIIAMPDGSFWASGPSSLQPIAYVSSARTDPTYLPGLPSGGLPTDWARATNGMLWFTEGGSGAGSHPNVIGRLDPTTGVAVEYGGLSPGAVAQSIVAGPDGNMWFLEFGTNSVGRITPSGSITEFPLPATAQLSRYFGGEMTFGPGGDLYFIVANGVARMTTSGSLVGVMDSGLPDFSADAIAYGHDGNLWASECGPDTVTRISPEGVFTRAAPGTFPRGACPRGIASTPDGTPWLFEFNTRRIGHVVFDSPLATTDDPTDVDPTAADLNGEATPRGAATTVHFEYGATTAYGRTTPDQAIGGGDAAVAVAARPTDLLPSTTYHYRLVVKSVISTVYGADQTVTTSALPPPPPPPLPVDRDGDGYSAGVDCDDLSAAIHPGADDKPADHIDQDCSGADAAFQRFQPHADAGWKTVHGRIVFTRMVIDAMPAGASLRIACSGKGCMKHAYSATIAKPVKRLDVTKRLHGARLGKGAKIELTLSRPGYITTIVRWTIGPPPKVTTLCQPPGAKKPTAC